MFSVLTFNCDKGNCNIDNIGPILRDSNADVICLQEFNQKVAIALLPYKLEEQYVFITAPLNQGWSSNVIYSRFPVIKSNNYTVEGKSRLSILARVLVANNPVDIVCVHLDPGRSNVDIRARQFTSLLSNFPESSIPTIITGDYNMDITEPRSGWPVPNWNSPPLLPTFSSTNACNTSPGKFAHPFDRCLYRNITLLNTKVVGTENVGSDHYGLLTTFQIGNIFPVRIPSAIVIPCPIIKK
jgi:endonuclease/exonuclease/phosphatase family metal-dependent hydrolase